MTPEALREQYVRANDAVGALADHLQILLVFSTALAAEHQETAGSELRRAVERARAALRVVCDELIIVEVVEHYLRRVASDRDRPRWDGEVDV